MSRMVSLDNTWQEYTLPNPMPYTPPQNPYPQGPYYVQPEQQAVGVVAQLPPEVLKLLSDLPKLMPLLERLSEQLEALEARVDELAHGE